MRHRHEEVYFVSISQKYTFLNIYLHKWNKISVIYFEYRYILCKCFFIYWKNRYVLIHVFDLRAGQYIYFESDPLYMYSDGDLLLCVDSEADPLVGWSKPRWWRADATYAALIAKVTFITACLNHWCYKCPNSV